MEKFFILLSFVLTFAYTFELKPFLISIFSNIWKQSLPLFTIRNVDVLTDNTCSIKFDATIFQKL